MEESESLENTDNGKLKIPQQAKIQLRQEEGHPPRKGEGKARDPLHVSLQGLAYWV